MRIYMINLDRSPERLSFMQDQLERLGLEAERIAAVDGEALDPASYAGTGLVPGEVGCFLSHREAWRRIEQGAEDVALVLEDDVRLSPDLPALLTALHVAALDQEIVKLDTSGRLATLDGAAQPLGTRALHRLLGEHTGTGGYLITRPAAQGCLAQATCIDRPVDLFLFGEGSISGRRVCQAVPAFVAQEKHFGKVDDGAMRSLIGRRKERRAKLGSIVARETARILGKIVNAARRLPHRLRGDRRYIRVPFR